MGGRRCLSEAPLAREGVDLLGGRVSALCQVSARDLLGGPASGGLRGSSESEGRLTSCG